MNQKASASVKVSQRLLPPGLWKDQKTGTFLLALSFVTALTECNGYPVWEMSPAWIDVFSHSEEAFPASFWVTHIASDRPWHQIPLLRRVDYLSEMKASRSCHMAQMEGRICGSFVLAPVRTKAGCRLIARIIHHDETEEWRAYNLEINESWRLQVVNSTHLDTPAKDPFGLPIWD